MAVSLALNPCANTSFQPPVYQFSNFTVTKDWWYDTPENGTAPVYLFNGHLNFTLRDIANNFSFGCSLGYDSVDLRGYASDPKEWGWLNCIPETGIVQSSSTRTPTLLNINDRYLLWDNQSQQTPIRVAQYWFCDSANGSYPDVYQARADLLLNVTCPTVGKRYESASCNITTPLPVTMNSTWIPRGTPHPGTRKLESRPYSPPTSKGISPPPARDCTDMSLTFPDWTLHDLVYKRPTTSDKTAASLNLSLTSRATGVRIRCQWGVGINVTESWDTTNEQVIVPACKPESDAPDPLHSNSTFQLWYRTVSGTLYIRQDWTCGDTAGAYSTNFIAKTAGDTAEAFIPLSCEVSTCHAEPRKIDGQLRSPEQISPAPIKSPEGIHTPNCLPGSSRNPWTLKRFLWQTTNMSFVNHGKNWFQWMSGETRPIARTLQLSFHNNANNYTASCNFTDPAFDGETEQWWPCFQQPGQELFRSPLQLGVETWFQFSARTGRLRVNHTWYCADEGPLFTPYKLNAQAITPTRDGLACGNGSNTWYGATCPSNPLFGSLGDSCDYTFTARWCTLGDREGNLVYPYWPVEVHTENLTMVRLPVGELSEPEPKPDVWSCTVSSLGRGPLNWTIRPIPPYPWLFVTDWFSWSQTDLLRTALTFSLDNSAFHNLPKGRSGLIEVRSYDSVELTPWMRTWDPTHVFASRGSGYDGDFYPVLGYSLQLDLSSGYMELNHSWYCDDKDPERPIVFNGTWRGHVPMKCSYEFPITETSGSYAREGIVCRFPGNMTGMVVTPTVTHYMLDKRISL